MGLLDSLFQQSTYGGQGGGLLDFLRTTADQNNQYQPSLGFAPAAPAQASPLQIGNYQMPRMGNPDLYQPQQVMTPPNAQPAQGQLPTQAPPQQELPPALGGNALGGNLGAAFQNFTNAGGLLPAVAGGITGLLTGQRTDQLGMQQQNLRAQFEATRRVLIDNGIDPRQAASTAMLSVLNPEAAKTVLPELLTNKEKYQVISEDPLEGKKYGFVNDRAQTVNGQPLTGGAPTQSTGGSLATLQQAQQAGVTGDALYGYLPPAYRNTVKAMIEGRQPLPSTTAMRSPATLALIDAAHAIDPSFDATVWKARNEAGPDWTKGKSSEMVRAANQTLAHVGSLMDAMDKLGNTRFPVANYVKNFANEATGGGEPGSFRTNAHAVAEEMSKVFKGANLSDSEIRHWEQNLSENMSREQQRAQIAKLSELLHGSLQALEEKRLTAMGPAMAAKQGPLIKDDGQRVLDRIDSWLHRNGAPTQSGTAPQVQEGATATNPQTGQKIIFRNGGWQHQ